MYYRWTNKSILVVVVAVALADAAAAAIDRSALPFINIVDSFSLFFFKYLLLHFNIIAHV